MTVAAYCASIDRGDVKVNRDYQRSDKVWPESARGYLIETIILGFPLPKMYLYPLTRPLAVTAARRKVLQRLRKPRGLPNAAKVF
jgi:hypothetical protein